MAKKKNDAIIIETANKDVIASYIFALSQKKDVRTIEQRTVLRLVEYAQDYGIHGLKIKDNIQQVELGLDRVHLTMPIVDICLNSHYTNEEVEIALKHLRNITFIYRYEDENKHPISIIAGILDKAIVDYGKGTVQLDIDNQVWQMISNFSKGYREFELNKALMLPNSYALQFYMMITGQKKPIFMSVEQMKEWLGIDATSYLTKSGKHRIDHLVERVIQPAKEALDAVCPYSFDYYKVKENIKNPKSKVLGFNFVPIYIAKNRDSALEKMALLPKVNVSWSMPINLRNYLIHRIGFTEDEIKTAKVREVMQSLVKVMPQPEAKISEIFDRARSRNITKPKGYLIMALEKEVQQAIARGELNRAKEQLTILPDNDDKTLMDAINKTINTKPQKEMLYSKEDAQTLYNTMLAKYGKSQVNSSLEDWMAETGWLWDNKRKMFVKYY